MIILNEDLNTNNIREQISNEANEVAADIGVDDVRKHVDYVIEQNTKIGTELQLCWDKLTKFLHETSTANLYEVVDAEGLTTYILNGAEYDVSVAKAYNYLTSEGLIEDETLLEIQGSYECFNNLDEESFSTEENNAYIYLKLVNNANLSNRIQNGMQVTLSFVTY